MKADQDHDSIAKLKEYFYHIEKELERVVEKVDGDHEERIRKNEIGYATLLVRSGLIAGSIGGTILGIFEIIKFFASLK